MKLSEEWILFILWALSVLFVITFSNCYTVNNPQSYPLTDRDNKLHQYKEDVTVYHAGYKDLTRYCQVHYKWEYINIINTRNNEKLFTVRNKPVPKIRRPRSIRKHRWPWRL